ncbi:hypothetical protein AB0I53_48840, partial [Saccharopolyspora sp. NPDC050389]
MRVLVAEDQKVMADTVGEGLRDIGLNPVPGSAGREVAVGVQWVMVRLRMRATPRAACQTP